MYSSNAAHKCNITGETAMHCYLECGWGPNKPNSLWDDKMPSFLLENPWKLMQQVGEF